MNTIQIEVGDWSSDGHGQCDTTIINTTFDHNAIQEAYKKGVEILGHNVAKVCEYYEASTIDLDFVEALSKHKFDKLEMENSYYVEQEGASIGSEEYLSIWLFTAQLGDPSFEYTELKPDVMLPIGGYGVFYQ